MLPNWADFRNRNVRDGAVAALVILVAFVSFLLGRLSSGAGEQAARIHMVQKEPGLPAAASAAIEGGVVASKTGSKYHLPWCAGAQTIREENKVWFKTAEEARRAGYTPAQNCKGIE